MKRTFIEAIKHRRSYYALSDQSPVSDDEIQKIIEIVAHYIPSAYNSQTTRMVLLLGDHHKNLWNIVKNTLQKRTKPETFVKTEQKIKKSFYSGYGTVLFFEDQKVVQELQTQFPTYKDGFPLWAQHSNAMHQFATWVMLEDVGFGVSLQHYNPLIDEEVKSTWNLPEEWQLVAQMPFGVPLDQPGEKEKLSLDQLRRVFI